MIKKLLDWLRGRWRTSKTKPFMVKVPKEAVLDPCKFLDTVAQGYHIRLFPPNLDVVSRNAYIWDMCYKIEQDPKQLVITNINRYTNKPRDYVSVRRMRIGDEIFFNDIDVGEL